VTQNQFIEARHPHHPRHIAVPAGHPHHPPRERPRALIEEDTGVDRRVSDADCKDLFEEDTGEIGEFWDGAIANENYC
jgi:hypothetical protein